MSLAWQARRDCGAMCVPDGWAVRRVGDLVKLTNGYPFPSESFGPTGEIPLVRIRDLNQGHFEYFVNGHIPSTSLLRDGDVVVGMDGDFNLTVWNRGRAALNQRLCLLRPRPGVDMRFMAYTLPSSLKIINDLTFSTTVKHLSSAGILRERVLLPPLEDQSRIADFLDAETARIDRLRALQEEVLSKLEERDAAKLDTAIDKLIEKCKTVPLRRYIWAVDQGSSPQCEATPAKEGEWGVLKVSCLRPGVFNPAENKRLPMMAPPDEHAEVKEGDLLITRANTPQLVGATAVAHGIPKRRLLSDKIFRVRLTHSVSPDFVSAVARGSRIRALCAATSNGASQSMANIRFEEVKAWPLPAADADEQLKFVREASRSRQQVDTIRLAIKRQLDLLTERRQALIVAAVTGQFDVSSASGRGVTEGVGA